MSAFREPPGAIAYRFSLGDLFDDIGRLRPFKDLPPEVQAGIASFDVVKITTRSVGETVTTEELIRVKLRDRRTAEVARRGSGSLSARVLRSQPLKRAIATTRERTAGAGQTAAAAAAREDQDR
jgi:hypothetical protein